MSEDQLQQAEDGPADHRHDGLDPTKEGLRDHLLGVHRVDVPDRLSTGTLQGMHDRSTARPTPLTTDRGTTT